MSLLSVAAPINKATRIRLLAREHKLSPTDIAALTGYGTGEIAAALKRGEPNKKPKSRAS